MKMRGFLWVYIEINDKFRRRLKVNIKVITIINLIFLIILILISIKVTPDFFVPIGVQPQKIDENVSIETPKIFSISIRNIGQSQMNLSYVLNGFDKNWLQQQNGSSLESLTTELKKSDVAFIQVTIDIPNGTIPGKYDGEILIKDNKSTLDDRPYNMIQMSLKINEPVPNSRDSTSQTPKNAEDGSIGKKENSTTIVFPSTNVIVNDPPNKDDKVSPIKIGRGKTC
jgi:hypothetical protein